MTFGDLRTILKSMGGPRLNRWVNGLLELDTNGSEDLDNLTSRTSHVMLLALADWVTCWVVGDESQKLFLLQRLKPAVTMHGDYVEEALTIDGNVELPVFQVGLADMQFVTWTESRKFYMLSTGEWCESLPQPAVFTVQLDLNALYFRTKQLVDELRKEAKS